MPLANYGIIQCSMPSEDRARSSAAAKKAAKFGKMTIRNISEASDYLSSKIYNPLKMTDRISAELRSRIMARIRGADTRPEMRVRRLLHGMGYRYRLHRRDLPGTPDLVFPARRKIIFVHGCFWHQHNCPRGSRPASNQDFWNRKLDKNVLRDRKNITALEGIGWSVLVVWECETNDLECLTERLDGFLRGGGSAASPRTGIPGG